LKNVRRETPWCFASSEPSALMRASTCFWFSVCGLGRNSSLETNCVGIGAAGLIYLGAFTMALAYLCLYAGLRTTTSAVAVLASLLEERAGGVPDLIAEVCRSAEAGGVTPEHVGEWLRRYLEISLAPLLRVFEHDGVSFEAHAQNSLLHTEDGWPARFWVRDMEGTSVSRSRLRRDLPDDSPLLYDDEQAWLRLRYHAVTNHLGQVVAALGRHGPADEATLWAAAGSVLAGLDCGPARDLVASPALPAKANLLSRFANRGEPPLYVDIPNPLFEVSS
jgi:siderophore synthetase component